MKLSTLPFALGRHPVILELFLLSKFTEIFRIEGGSVVALKSPRSSIGGEDVSQSLLVGLEVG